MTQEEIIYNNIAFVKKVKKAEGYCKIGYYDRLSGTCLISAIGKGLRAAENALIERAKVLKVEL